MLNQDFSETSYKEKSNKIKRIIYSKTKSISVDQVSKILEHIDFNQQYYIKVISNPKKFKNMITTERVLENGIYMQSFITRIFGNFVCGYYECMDSEKKIKKSILEENIPAAVICEKKEQYGQKIVTEYTLIVYVPFEN